MATSTSKPPIKKRYVSPNEVHLIGIALANLVIEKLAEFKPDVIISLWRGAAPFGLVLDGMLKMHGINVENIPVRTESYTAPGEQNSVVSVYGLNRVIDVCDAHHKVLIVDDVFESGGSVDAVLEKMRLKMRANMPLDVRVAVAFRKPLSNKTSLTPHYVVEDTTDWLVFPHEMNDLKKDEILSLMGSAVYDAMFGSSSVVGPTSSDLVQTASELNLSLQRGEGTVGSSKNDRGLSGLSDADREKKWSIPSPSEPDQSYWTSYMANAECEKKIDVKRSEPPSAEALQTHWDFMDSMTDAEKYGE